MADPTPTDIQIPPALLPEDGRFGSGPSKIRPDIIAAMFEEWGWVLGTSHRQDPVRSLVRHVKEGLQALWALPDGYEVAIGNGGSTLFWDIAAVGLIEQHSQHTVFGEFSAKFAQNVAAAPFLEKPQLIEANPGDRAVARAEAGVDFYALVHNETSTGVLGNIARPDGADATALVAVDATSAAGAVPWEPAATDVYYFAPQKCFASDGGLWLAVLSPAAVERAFALRDAGRWVPPSLDLPTAIEQSRLDQTLNTPALFTLALLAAQLDWILAKGGLPFATQRTRKSSKHLYRWASKCGYAIPFVAAEEARSPVVVTVDFSEDVSAKTVAAVLRANGILDTEPYRKLGRNQLRIGVYPAVDPEDVKALTACIDWVVGEI